MTDRAIAICLYLVLRDYTDSDHIMPMREIIAKLSALYDLKPDRRTIYSAIDVLVRLGYDISTFEENKRGYYLRTREFEASEIKILMDAIYSLDYIPPKQAMDLIQKLQQFLSVHERKRYQHLYVVRRERKIQNPEVFLNVELLDEAITKKRQVSFCYLDYDLHKKLQPRRNKAYVLSPYGMVHENEHYYLIAIKSGTTTPSLYRIDLMRDVEVLDEPIEVSAENAHLDSVENVTYAFVGKPEMLRLRCDKTVLRHVLDRFGADIVVIDNEDETFTANFTASPQGVKYWALQFLPYVEVLSPQWLRDEIMQGIKKNKYGVKL